MTDLTKKIPCQHGKTQASMVKPETWHTILDANDTALWSYDFMVRCGVHNDA